MNKMNFESLADPKSLSPEWFEEYKQRKREREAEDTLEMEAEDTLEMEV